MTFSTQQSKTYAPAPVIDEPNCCKRAQIYELLSQAFYYCFYIPAVKHDPHKEKLIKICKDKVSHTPHWNGTCLNWMGTTAAPPSSILLYLNRHMEVFQGTVPLMLAIYKANYTNRIITMETTSCLFTLPMFTPTDRSLSHMRAHIRAHAQTFNDICKNSLDNWVNEHGLNCRQ